ncbi:hypothetical protein K7G98_14145 [Saccharothrix sp. MB29]|nr:hypothetical protein [Saccharothrix sp. MB29]
MQPPAHTHWTARPLPVHLVGSLPHPLCDDPATALGWVLRHVDGVPLTALPFDRDPRWIIDWLTHDLAAALEVADRVVICRHGRTVDEARPADFRGAGPGDDHLTHPYTRALWRALPANGFHLPEDV